MPHKEDIDPHSVWSSDRPAYRCRRTTCHSQSAQDDTCDYCYQTMDRPGDRYELILPSSPERFYVHTVCSGPMRDLTESTSLKPLGRAKHSGSETWRMFGSTLNLPEAPHLRTSTQFDKDSAAYLLEPTTSSGPFPLVHGFPTRSEAEAHYKSHKAEYLPPCTAEQAAEVLRFVTQYARNRILAKEPKLNPDPDECGRTTYSYRGGTRSSSSSTLNRSRRSVFPAAVHHERTRRGPTEGTWLYGCGGSL